MGGVTDCSMMEVCPIHPKTGKWIKIRDFWKLQCKDCYKMMLEGLEN